MSTLVAIFVIARVVLFSDMAQVLCLDAPWTGAPLTALLASVCKVLLAGVSSGLCILSAPVPVAPVSTPKAHLFTMCGPLFCCYCNVLFMFTLLLDHDTWILFQRSCTGPFHDVCCRFKALLHGATGPRPALVNLYPDGTVLLTVAGTEMGQGLFTKAKQVCLLPFLFLHL